MQENKNNLKIIEKQFMCCTPLNKFIWPDFLCNLDNEAQKEIIQATVKNDLAVKLSIKNSYKKAFLKFLLNKFENNECEINDEVYKLYCDSISVNDEEMHFKHYLINDPFEYLSIKESTNLISQGTTGLCSWKAAFTLAEWCVENKKKLKELNVLELGSGVGLTGLTAIKLCKPKTFIFSDCHQFVLNTLKENVDNNLKIDSKFTWTQNKSTDSTLPFITSYKDSEIQVIKLNWEEVNDWNLSNKIDIIIAADILYDNRTFRPLIAGLKKLLFNNVQSFVIVVATVRNQNTVSEFLSELDDNLEAQDLPLPITNIFMHVDDTPVRIFKISMKNK